MSYSLSVDSDRVRAPVVDIGPIGSGGGQSLIRSNSPASADKEFGKGGEKAPFWRRDLIRRSPINSVLFNTMEDGQRRAQEKSGRKEEDAGPFKKRSKLAVSPGPKDSRRVQQTRDKLKCDKDTVQSSAESINMDVLDLTDEDAVRSVKGRKTQGLSLKIRNLNRRRRRGWRLLLGDLS